jgi:hypothetical protein
MLKRLIRNTKEEMNQAFKELDEGIFIKNNISID